MIMLKDLRTEGLFVWYDVYMIKDFQKQSGSAHVIIIIILILALLGTLGFIFWQNFIKPDSAVANTGKGQREDITTQKAIEEKGSTSVEPSKNYAYVDGVSFNVDKSVGTVLSWALTSENYNISSSSLLDKEKATYGDTNLVCTANNYPLGRISVRNSSTPYPGFVLVKKLESGKYVYYQDDGMTSECYSTRTELRDMIAEQVDFIKEGLDQAQ